MITDVQQGGDPVIQKRFTQWHAHPNVLLKV